MLCGGLCGEGGKEVLDGGMEIPAAAAVVLQVLDEVDGQVMAFMRKPVAKETGFCFFWCHKTNNLQGGGRRPFGLV